MLEAKLERVRQGPGYPPANAFTGRHDQPAPTATPHESGEPAATVPSANKPDPEATFGGQAFTHGRGNQGMRKQS